MKYKLISESYGRAAIENCINNAAQDGWRFCAVVESKHVTRLSVVILMEKPDNA